MMGSVSCAPTLRTETHGAFCAVFVNARLPQGSFADVYIEYDSDGLWLPAGHIEGTGTKTFMLPLRPRRCDHFRFRIEGEGDVRIFSFAKILEVGSDM